MPLTYMAEAALPVLANDVAAGRSTACRESPVRQRGETLRGRPETRIKGTRSLETLRGLPARRRPWKPQQNRLRSPEGKMPSSGMAGEALPVLANCIAAKRAQRGRNPEVTGLTGS